MSGVGSNFWGIFHLAESTEGTHQKRKKKRNQGLALIGVRESWNSGNCWLHVLFEGPETSSLMPKERDHALELEAA